MLNHISGTQNRYYLTPPTKAVRSIKPQVYLVDVPMMGPACIFPSYANSLKNLRKDSVSWDFTGCKQYDLCMSDLQRFYGADEFYRKVGVRHRRGIILHGPPGTGKTVIGKALALKAMQLGYPVINVTEQREMRVVVQLGVKCMVWIDEIDEVEDLTLSIDNLADGCFVVGTTNYPQKMLERITKRPGRFDRVLKIDKMTPGMIRKMCSKYFIDNAFNAIESTFDTITPAQLAQVSLRHHVYGVSIQEAVKTVREDFR